MRIQGADLRDRNRKPLKDLVPLAAPLSVYVEPTSACNIRCAFCPTGNPDLLKRVGRKAGVMEWVTFWKVLAGLYEFGRKIPALNFFKDGEPLLNKDYPEMAKELAGICDKLRLKTNGLLLTPSLSDGLVKANFDMIGISVIAPHADGYKRVSGVDIDYQAFVDEVHYLYNVRGNTKIYVKMSNVNFSEAEIAKFYHDFEPISDYIAIENLHGWSRTDLKDFTLGTKPDNYDGQPNVKRVACAWPLYQMTINWNGTVQGCAEDWARTNIMGDIHQNTLKEIWNGDKFNEFRRMQLEGRRYNNAACGSCWQTMSCIDDVDPYRTELLERLK